MKKTTVLTGIVKRHPDGFGFFIPDNSEWPDVYIPKHSMVGVMSNDRIEVKVLPEPGGDRYRGEVLQIHKRFSDRITGILRRFNDRYAIIPDSDNAWGQDMKIPLNKIKDAKFGELVAATIVQFPDAENHFEGEVFEVIGNINDPLTDTKRVIHSHNIPTAWSAKTLQEIKEFSPEVDLSDVKGRKDLRNFNFITIDGATAKDFDDAIYVEVTRGGFHLWVAIADVSHYVRPNTALDKDAYERGNSTYFPNYVVPMLPEILSNELCSLRPHTPRLAVVSEIKYSFSGEIEYEDFYEAIIESKARVTYGEAQEVIDGTTPEKIKHVEKEILNARDLAKILMGKRFAHGSLDLEIPETEIVLDAGGFPVDIIRSERLFAHRLIEELMLAANVAVAKFIHGHEVPSVYRIHDNPDEEKIKVLSQFLHNFGSNIKISGGNLAKKLTKALDVYLERPEGQILSILTLRSMKQAQYSPENSGHFGLGFECYTHFTSPIRRYPDLIVHRALKAILFKSDKYPVLSGDYVATAGTMLSACEQRSAKAERQFKAIKRARFLSRHVGREFDGMISSLTKFGVFVLLRQYDVDGLVRIENLGDDYFEYDEENMVILGKRTKTQFRLGQMIRIKVSQADIDAGFIDFELVGVTGEKKRGPNTNEHSNRKHDQKRKSPKDDRGGVRKARVSKHPRKGKSR